MSNKYKKKPNGKNATGRPCVITDEIIAKLEQAFAIGCTDQEACHYAEISSAALYRYQESHPEFRERKEGLKDRPILKAKFTIVKHLDDPRLAWDYLRSKCSDEFAQKVKQDVSATTSPVPIILGTISIPEDE